MYTIEKRSYGFQITLDTALEPHEIENLASDLKFRFRSEKRPFEPLGILIRPANNAQNSFQPRVYVIDEAH